ncbi:MAG: 50S ribosomal protein L16 [Planctomyces sp.]|nr:50S ribosomal protein L16 [Planctomyces sp.]
MALMPKRVKHRKSQRGRIKGNATRGNTVAFGEFGLQSTQAGHIRATTIEACRIAANQYIRGEGKLYIRIFPDKPKTARPLETRMGTGKGEPDHWVAVVKPGTVMFEIAGASRDAARECFNRVAHKLPVGCRLVERRPGT